MSSILRALKKLEKDLQSDDIQAGGKKIRVKKVVHQRIKNSLAIKRLFWISFTIVLSTISVWIIINVSKQSSPINDSGIKSVDSPPSMKKSEKATDPVLSSNSSPVKPVFERSPHSLPLKKEQSKEQEAGNDKMPQNKISQQNEIPKLTLKGILWSDIPERRVAIINAHHLKQGDEIDGAQVIQIGKKSVTLKIGDKRWTIYIR